MNIATKSSEISFKNKAIAVANIINYSLDRNLFYSHKIAKPNEDYYVFDNKLLIAGWVVGKEAINSIKVYLEKDAISTAYLTVKRPGLNKKYQKLAKKYNTEFGFRTIIELPKIEAAQQLILKACFEDGIEREIGKINLKTVDLEREPKPLHISPDFMVIGAMKSATSAIYDYLCRHSRVLKRKPKEIHFFSKAHVYDRGWNWYLSQFATKQKKVGDRQISVGEASPSYLSSPEAPKNIKGAFPKIKIIVSLRNPVERAISHYYHQVSRVDDEPRNIQDAFSAAEIAKSIEAIKSFGNDEMILRQKDRWKTTRYLSEGLYASQLKNWLEVFSPEQLLILDYHQLETNPNLFLDKLFGFLNLQDDIPCNVEKVYFNNYPDAPPEVKERLNNFFKTYNEELKAMSEIDLSWI